MVLCGIVQFWVEICGLAWCREVSSGIMGYYLALCDTAWHCGVLCGFVRCCGVVRAFWDIVVFCVIL